MYGKLVLIQLSPGRLSYKSVKAHAQDNAKSMVGNIGVHGRACCFIESHSVQVSPADRQTDRQDRQTDTGIAFFFFLVAETISTYMQ